MIVASDLIGTLTTGSPVLGLVDWVRHNQSKMRADLYTASIMPSYVMAKLGWINVQKWASRLMVTCLPLVKDPTLDKIDAMANWSVEKHLWPQRREDVIKRLVDHKAQGAEVVIASSVYQPTVEVFASHIGARTVATPLEIHNGILSIPEKLFSEQQKVNKVLERMAVKKIDVAYGDTWQDIPLLENAERPVAVYPDQVLKAVALEHGWEILGERER